VSALAGSNRFLAAASLYVSINHINKISKINDAQSYYVFFTHWVDHKLLQKCAALVDWTTIATQ